MEAEENNRIRPVVHPIVIWCIAAAIYEKKRAQERRTAGSVIKYIHPARKTPMAIAIGVLTCAHTPHVRGGSVSRRGLTQLTGNRTTLQAEPSQKNRAPRTPAALRERGVWGERRFSQRSGLSPQRSPTPNRLGCGHGG